MIDSLTSGSLCRSAAVSLTVSLCSLCCEQTRLTDSVTITPTSSKSTSDRLRQLEMLATKVEIKPVAKDSGAVSGPSVPVCLSGFRLTGAAGSMLVTG